MTTSPSRSASSSSWRRPENQAEHFWIVDVESGLALATTDAHPGGQSWPSWSPVEIDGEFIAFASRHETYGQEGSVDQIYTVRVNGVTIARRTWGGSEKMLPRWIGRIE